MRDEAKQKVPTVDFFFGEGGHLFVATPSEQLDITGLRLERDRYRKALEQIRTAAAVEGCVWFEQVEEALNGDTE